MKTKILVLFLLLVSIFMGCKKKVTTIEPESKYVYFMTDANTAKAYIMAMLPQINSMYNETKEATSQNQWLIESLDKCLKMLETEKGLKPIYPKYFLKGDPNLLPKYSESNEPKKETWFVPYKGSTERDLAKELDNIAVFRSEIGTNPTIIAYHNELIRNFEERLKRLDPNQPIQKLSE